MSSRSSGALALSALMHGALVALVLFFSYAARSVVEDSPKIFELVAGAGNNYAATAAPALGSPAGIKVTAQTPVPAAPTPAPRPQPSPIQAAPKEKAPPKPPKPVDLVAELNRVEARREKRLEERYKKEEAAEEKKLAQEKLAAAKAAHIDAEGIANGVLGGSAANKEGGAGGKALTREEGHELEAYFALLKTRIKENHVPPEGLSDTLSAKVEFFVAANGDLSGVRIARSSGNTDFDLSVLEACRHTQSIGPRPDGRSEMVEMTFRMREDESP